jgi:hypothetical protein
MHQKLDLLEGRHSASVGLPDEKPIVHSAWAATQLVELPIAGDGTLDTRNATSQNWDVASRPGNTSSGIADVELASVHGPDTGL